MKYNLPNKPEDASEGQMPMQRETSLQMGNRIENKEIKNSRNEELISVMVSIHWRVECFSNSQVYFKWNSKIV